jgi:hypothetical protein
VPSFEAAVRDGLFSGNENHGVYARPTAKTEAWHFLMSSGAVSPITCWGQVVGLRAESMSNCLISYNTTNGFIINSARESQLLTEALIRSGGNNTIVGNGQNVGTLLPYPRSVTSRNRDALLGAPVPVHTGNDSPPLVGAQEAGSGRRDAEARAVTRAQSLPAPGGVAMPLLPLVPAAAQMTISNCRTKLGSLARQ